MELFVDLSAAKIKKARLKDLLTGPERDELANVMRNEPVAPGDTISHHTAKSLMLKGLIERYSNPRGWMACWDQIQRGEITNYKQ
jgi:hypothetical protein